MTKNSKGTIAFSGHFHEQPPGFLKRIEKTLNTKEHKTAIWNAFVDSELTGINDDDCAIMPRILPGSYLPVIRKAAHDITLFTMRLLSLPEREIRAIIPAGPIRDFLIDELQVLKFHPERLIGSFRFDMAITGEADRMNPPKLLEINEMGFDGLARSSFIQQTYLKLVPDLKKHVYALDTARAEVRNMLRLGPTIARFQYDCYNWDEEVLVRTGKKLGADLRLVSPAQFQHKIDDDYPLMLQAPVVVRNGHVRIGKELKPDAVQMSIAYRLRDYHKGQKIYRDIVRSKTPQYTPFIMGLVASKMILVLMSDPSLRKKLLGSSRKLENVILPARALNEQGCEWDRDCIPANEERWRNCVLKHVDGLGGEQVYMDQDLLKQLKSINHRERGHYVMQERTKLNILTVNGMLSRPRRVIADLGVFVQYDWANGKFQNFGVGGFITRATNRSFKVNVSGGGLQVPVMFTRT